MIAPPETEIPPVEMIEEPLIEEPEPPPEIKKPDEVELMDKETMSSLALEEQPAPFQ